MLSILNLLPKDFLYQYTNNITYTNAAGKYIKKKRQQAILGSM